MSCVKLWPDSRRLRTLSLDFCGELEDFCCGSGGKACDGGGGSFAGGRGIVGTAWFSLSVVLMVLVAALDPIELCQVRFVASLEPDSRGNLVCGRFPRQE